MPKSNKCCPSSKSHNGSCVEKCVKECKEAYCRAKYEKLAVKLLKTGLIQDSCNYAADRNLDVVAGAKFQWLNVQLINEASSPSAADLAPAGYGSVAAFQAVDPTLSNYVFALSYSQTALLNATLTGAGQGVPLVQDILEDYYGVGLGYLTAPPGTAPLPTWGTSNLTNIADFATTTASAAGYPALAAYTNAYITAMQQIIAALPVTQAIAGPLNVPLFNDVTFTVNSANNEPVTQVATVGIIRLQDATTVTTDDVFIIYGVTRNACPPLC